MRVPTHTGRLQGCAAVTHSLQPSSTPLVSFLAACNAIRQYCRTCVVALGYQLPSLRFSGMVRRYACGIIFFGPLCSCSTSFHDPSRAFAWSWRVIRKRSQLELRAGELISRIPGRSEGRFRPVAIQDMVRDERICLIYVGTKRFLLFRCESISDDLWAALAAWSGKSRTC